MPNNHRLNLREKQGRWPKQCVDEKYEKRTIDRARFLTFFDFDTGPNYNANAENSLFFQVETTYKKRRKFEPTK